MAEKKKEMKSLMITCEKCNYVCIFVTTKNKTVYKCGKCNTEQNIN